jgi:hypothetical protein
VSPVLTHTGNKTDYIVRHTAGRTPACSVAGAFSATTSLADPP